MINDIFFRSKYLAYFLALLFVFSSLSVIHNVGMERFNTVLFFLSVLLISFLCLASYRFIFLNFRLPVVLGLVFILGAIFRYVSISILEPNVTSDWLAMYTAAQHIANGDFNNVQTMSYFDVNVYQLGYSAYMSIYVLIFDNSVFAIKLVNIVCSLLTVFFIYKLSHIYFDDFVSSLASAMFLFYAGGVVYASVLTNEHIAILFFYAGFYFVCKYELKILPMFLAGVLIGIGNFFRPVGPVVIIAFVCYAVLSLENFKLKGMFFIFKAFLAILIGYKGFFIVSSELFKYIGITEHMLVNRDPYWKFVLGFNSDSTGQWSRDDNAILNTLPIGEERFSIAKELISERTNNIFDVLGLMFNKMVLMWGGYNMTVFWAFVGKDNLVFWKRMIENIELAQYFTALFFASFGVAKTEVVKKSFYFLVLVCLGYFAVHLFIEINTRYRYFLMPIIFILAANGVKVFLESSWVKKLIKEYS